MTDFEENKRSIFLNSPHVHAVYVSGLHIEPNYGFDMTASAYRSTTVDSDHFFDSPKMARYKSIVDSRYDMAVPVWLEYANGDCNADIGHRNRTAGRMILIVNVRHTNP